VASAGSWAGRPVSESGCSVTLLRWGPMRPAPRTSLMLATLPGLTSDAGLGARSHGCRPGPHADLGAPRPAAYDWSTSREYRWMTSSRS
jgi:hypothetical protein